MLNEVKYAPITYIYRQYVNIVFESNKVPYDIFQWLLIFSVGSMHNYYV